MGKAGLAHDALGHHTACQCHQLAAVGLVGQFLKFFLQVSGIRVLRELGQGKGVVAGGLQVGQLLAAHLYLLALGQTRSGISLLLFHGYSYLVCRMGDGQQVYTTVWPVGSSTSALSHSLAHQGRGLRGSHR